MSWRRTAREHAVLIADGKSSDPAAAGRIARTHRGADHVTLNIHDLLRTRTEVPEDLRELARVGGGAVEPID